MSIDMITLQPVTVENFDDVLALRVAPGQEGLVASNAESIAQVYVQPECCPYVIYNGDQVVGFLMYCLDADDSEYWLYRLMIDAAHQRKGYAEAAMRCLLERIKEDPAHHILYLGVDLRGEAAPALYKKLGFQFDGRVFGKEHIMRLEY